MYVNNNMSFDSRENEFSFLRKKHIDYCLRSLKVLPRQYESFDSTRLMVVFFSVSSLDLLNALSEIESDNNKIIEWIYHLQVLPTETDSNSGFCGSMCCTPDNIHLVNSSLFDQPNIAMTYTALTTLLILGDDLSRVDKMDIIKSLRKLQLSDGSYRAISSESENDMRFVYCASVICYIFQDWSGMDIEKAVWYIKNSLSYDGGIAQGPGLEAHGGSTFCAVASLSLMGRLESTFTPLQLKRLSHWCLFRQQDGFQGRPNKPTDTCYSFWVGATLKLLDCYHLINQSELLKYVLSTQDVITGGISKWVDHIPDIMHTYLGISGLSLTEIGGISSVHPALNISGKASKFLAELQNQWSCVK